MSLTNQKVTDLVLDAVLCSKATTTLMGAKVLIRRIIPIAISSILHQRINANQNNFIGREHNGIPYVIFNAELNERLLREVCQWIDGVLEAFDKNYLEEIYLLFCSTSDETDVKETYKFQIKYYETNENSQELATAKQETLHRIDQLLRSINGLKSFTKLNKDEVTASIALRYSSNVPTSYHPRYFEAINSKTTSIMDNIFQGNEAIVNLGALRTKSYRMICSGKGKLLSVPDKPNTLYISRITDESVDDDNWFKENEFDSKYHAPCLGYMYSTINLNSTCCNICETSTSPSSPESMASQTKRVHSLARSYAFINNRRLEELIKKERDRQKLLQSNCGTADDLRYTANVEMVKKTFDDLFPTENTTTLPDSCIILLSDDDDSP